MKIIQIQVEQLERIWEWASHNKRKFPFPIYLEVKNTKFQSPNLLLIKYGECFDYFTKARVLFPKGINIENIKIILEYNQLDLNSNSIQKAQTVPGIKIENILKSFG